MIFLDVFKKLASDVVLADYLKPTPSDSKIYPNFARALNRPPYLVYKSSGVNNEEIMRSETITFYAVAEEYFIMAAMAARLDDIFANEKITSAYFDIYDVKKVSVSDYADAAGRHVRAIGFNFKFTKKQEIL